MSVEHILAAKGRNVLTVEPDSTLARAASIMGHHGVGALVVVGPDGDVEGIISERDVVRAVAQDGGGALAEPLSKRMTAAVVTCRPSFGIDEIMSMMTQGKFRHVPVIESGRLAGIVSIGDIVKFKLAEIEAEHRALKDYIATA